MRVKADHVEAVGRLGPRRRMASLPGHLALAGALTAALLHVPSAVPVAHAQAGPDFGSIVISGLRKRYSHAGKPDPSMGSEDETAYFYHRRADGMIMGAWLTTSCPQGTGRGRLPFTFAGGPSSGSDVCERSFRSAFRWSSTVGRQGGRFVLNGRGETSETCVRGDCGVSSETVTERATFRIEGRRCIVESYHRQSVAMRHGKPSAAATYTSTARTRCSIQ